MHISGSVHIKSISIIYVAWNNYRLLMKFLISDVKQKISFALCVCVTISTFHGSDAFILKVDAQTGNVGVDERITNPHTFSFTHYPQTHLIVT